MACNTMPIYEKLLSMRFNEKYKFVWRVQDKNKYKNFPVKNVSFINYEPTNLLERLTTSYYQWTSKALIFSNRMSKKHWKNQFSFFLGHGTLIKCLGGYKIHNDCDYLLSCCKKLDDVTAFEVDIDKRKIVDLGYPRNDVLGSTNNSLEVLSLTKFNKVIIWMPTFRHHKCDTSAHIDGRILSFGLPLIDTVEQINSLNKILNEFNLALVVKLHPVQDTRMVEEFNRSNILFISDEFIISQGTSLYKFIACTSALLTDYSSIYFDYLHTGKPIGLIVDDIEEYRSNRGLAIPYEEMIKGVYIHNCSELENFIKDIGNNIDLKKEERLQAQKDYCDFMDFKSTERVVNFILSKI